MHFVVSMTINVWMKKNYAYNKDTFYETALNASEYLIHLHRYSKPNDLLDSKIIINKLGQRKIFNTTLLKHFIRMHFIQEFTNPWKNTIFNKTL